MKKLFSTLLLLATICLPAMAQETTNKATNRGSNVEEATQEDYQQIMDSKVFVAVRAQAVNSLNLSEEQTSDFTPLLMEYTKRKEDLAQRRVRLVEKYADEMSEDDRIKDEMNETGDFIENYWEVDIAEMELKKDFFDRMEDVITPTKALRFFANEEMYNRRAKRNLLVEKLPEMYILFPNPVTYQFELDDFREWKRLNIDGMVALDHQFTANGLTKLLNAAEAMAQTEGISVDNFASRKADVMTKTEMLKQNWKSLKHADYARQAFVSTADILAEIANDSRFETKAEWLSKLNSTAKMINPDKKLTDQASTVYTFFNTAEAIVNDLVAQANKTK